MSILRAFVVNLKVALNIAPNYIKFLFGETLFDLVQLLHQVQSSVFLQLFDLFPIEKRDLFVATFTQDDAISCIISAVQ